MDIENIKNIIKSWAESEALIKSAYIFGSRARNDYKNDSDLDVAVEIHPLNDESSYAAWVFEKKKLKESLSKLIPYQLQLEQYDGDDTPIIKGAIESSSILVYVENE